MMDMDELLRQVSHLNGAINALTAQNTQQQAELLALRHRGDDDKIPDLIKSIPKFNGDRKTLSNWIQNAEFALNVYADANARQKSIFLFTLKSKLEDKALEAVANAGCIETFEELKQVLTDVLGDKNELSFYKSKLWRSKMKEESLFTYFKRTKDTVQRIKQITKKKEIYAMNWEGIERMLDEDALAAFIYGLDEKHFSYVQTKSPQSLDEAYAFLSKIESYDRYHKSDKRTRVDTDRFKSFKKTEPMEVDTSMRSRVNKPTINTHEGEDGPDTSSDEQEELFESDKNFHSDSDEEYPP